ncbi:hypothetical protein EIP86_009135 [Pleurotus ostreatoroseus]|nr:hypothetical protein EIP86_009135 [Pleurotus ostreatoroseus]
MTVHEAQVLPEGFTSRGAAFSDTMLNLRLALAQTDPDGMIQSLMDISTPGNALYGRQFTKEEVAAFVAPKPETVQAVQTWLKENDITAQINSPAGDWLSFSIPVSKANELLDTEFTVFAHDETNMQFVRTLAYSIPADLTGHVLLVHPTVAFPNPLGSKPLFFTPKSQAKINASPSNVSSDAVPSSCSSSIITPTCIQDLYGVPTTKATQSSNKIGVSGFIQQFANKNDLQNLRPDLIGNTFITQTLDGGSNPQNNVQAGTNADLDTQYTIGIASGVPNTFISVGPQNQDGSLGGFLDLINFLIAQPSRPQVLTTSYGQNENNVGRAMANSLCNAMAQLGMLRTSILFSSGDGGVGGAQSGTQCTNFLASFPSGCPFMTSVGATSGVPETSASFSSGGFSNFFSTPTYQKTAVSAYLTSLGNINTGKFNSSGRAYPDVAALVAAGKPVLGFLNPWLYGSAASTFTDITTGSNPGCNTNGFPTESGWDPVTGLGTPNFLALAAAAFE